jgi:ureidoacrylate peracid hydrolase
MHSGGNAPVAANGSLSAERAHRVAARVDAESSVLVVIDAQNDFCHPQGMQALQGKDVGRAVEPVRRLQLLVEAARENQVPVVLVRTTHGVETDTPEWLARHGDPGRAQSCQDGSWGADFYGVQPAPGDHVVVKHRYSAFTSGELARLLDRLGRRSLLFAGFTTGTCVESSLRDAVCLDFLATLVEDCCGAYTQRAHERAVEAVQEGFGLVANSDEAIRSWRSAELRADEVVASA